MISLKKKLLEIKDPTSDNYTAELKNIIFDKLKIESESEVGLKNASDKVYACKGLKKEDETSDFTSFYLDEIENVQKNYKSNENLNIDSNEMTHEKWLILKNNIEELIKRFDSDKYVTIYFKSKKDNDRQ